MLGPTVVRLTYFFYPIGNTPAVNLLETGLHENEKNGTPVRILSLGCGDPRNILFTLWCNKELAHNLKWDFTCCDVEPAIFARNILLFSFIIDDVAIGSMWNLFYHLFVTDTDLKVLNVQVETLLQASASLEDWYNSRYGSIIRFVSNETLHQVRRFWTEYSEVTTLGSSGRKRTKAKVTRAIKERHSSKKSIVIHGLRAAGPHWKSALALLPSCFERFWETGVAGGNFDDQRDLRNSGGGRVNPLMAVSSEPNGAFAVHYGSDPLIGYHLASAFDDKTETSAEDVVRLAKSQFTEWCIAFKDRACLKAIKIRVFCGDALRFCYALQCLEPTKINWHTQIIRLYASAWRSTALNVQEISGECQQILFDIIDTSNLVDHIGVLNILPAISPLLSRKATSVLFTDCLLKVADNTATALPMLLCSDVTTFSLLLGLTPVGHLLGYTVEATGNEVALRETFPVFPGMQSQNYLRIPWKCLDFRDPDRSDSGEIITSRLLFQQEQLVEFCFALYLKMFSYEDMGTLKKLIMRQVISPSSVDLRHYNRMSFVALLGLVKTRGVAPNWDGFMQSVVDKIESDKTLLIGSNQIQEFEVLLHICGLYSTDVLRAESPRSFPRFGSMFGPLRSPSQDVHLGLLDQRDIPSIVWLALSVPRQNLAVFTSLHQQNPRGSGSPGLYVDVSQLEKGLANSFFSNQCFFGKLVMRGDTCDILEDENGWAGTSDLIVTCAVPAWILLIGSADAIRVDLTVSASPESTQIYTPKLGIRMNVYGCGLRNRNLVVLKQPPGACLGEFPPLESSPSSEACKEACVVRLDSRLCAKEIAIRKCHEQSKESITEMAKKLRISAYRLSTEMSDDDSENLVLQAPYPIRSVRAVEITQNMVSAFSRLHSLKSFGDPAAHNPFPIHLGPFQPTPLTFPRLNLDQEAVIPLNANGKATWIERFSGLGFSLFEQRLKERMSYASYPPQLKLKHSINSLLHVVAGLDPDHHGKRLFSLARASDNGITMGDIIIAVSQLRHNMAQQSIVMDAYVIPMTESRETEMLADPAYESLELLSIIVGPQEHVLWKLMIPAIVEACRLWEHGPTCEYRSSGEAKAKPRIPLSTEYRQMPICSCGEGKDVDGFPHFPGWQSLQKHATRVALMPLSAVPWVEGVNVIEGAMPSEPPTAMPKGPTECSSCGKTSNALKICARCEVARYCNQKCQKEDWKVHKKACKKSAVEK